MEVLDHCWYLVLEAVETVEAVVAGSEVVQETPSHSAVAAGKGRLVDLAVWAWLAHRRSIP
jgi:hypothetical protein